MAPFRTPDGLDKLWIILSALTHDVSMAIFRRRMAAITGSSFAALFVILVAGETLFATLMFSIISVEVLGHVVSGAAFALMVPTVITAAHVRLHYEGDHFTAWWLNKMSGIGILIFALGMSLMVGYSAWQAAQDAMSVLATGPTGTLGNRQVDAAPEASSGIAEWIGIIPNSLLFLGLSFGMIVTIYVASFALGRALQAFNFLTQTMPIDPALKPAIEALKVEMLGARALRDEDDAAHWKLPLDIKSRFARAAHNACWTVYQTKLSAARRKFDPMRLDDPLATAFHDAEADTIPNRFNSERTFTRHMDDQMDQMRLHNLMRVLSGTPNKGDKQ